MTRQFLKYLSRPQAPPEPRACQASCLPEAFSSGTAEVDQDLEVNKARSTGQAAKKGVRIHLRRGIGDFSKGPKRSYSNEIRSSRQQSHGDIMWMSHSEASILTSAAMLGSQAACGSR